jgi:acetoin utilization deacetylase AcuC-like enzyme
MGSLSLPVVFDEDVLRHDPRAEIWVGVRLPGTELAARAVVLRDAVVAAGARLVAPADDPAPLLASVHDAGFLRHLETVYDDWVSAGFPVEPGQDRVVPYVFPTAAMLEGLAPRTPAAIHGRAGLYCYDTMTLVGPGTWEAARAAAASAVTAARLALASSGPAYAVCRPPGHHATRSGYGGSCYLNNAAVAAAALLNEGASRVAVIDVDAHHGNGTQSIFYDRADVLYASVHVDPGAGWFPHYAGYADERGTGAGRGANLNIPLAPGSGDAEFLDGVTRMCAFASEAYGVDAAVLSLGVDAAADDPESPLQVTHDGYERAGALVGQLGMPVVAVHEGGYHLPTLGSLTVAALRGLARPTDVAEGAGAAGGVS